MSGLVAVMTLWGEEEGKERKREGRRGREGRGRGEGRREEGRGRKEGRRVKIEVTKLDRLYSIVTQEPSLASRLSFHFSENGLGMRLTRAKEGRQ